MLPMFDFAHGFANGAAALTNRPAVDAVLLDPTAGDDGSSSSAAVDNVAAFVSAGYRVCLYTLDQRPHFLARCRRAGARGVVMKSDPLDTLIDCLVQVARGRVAISSNVTLPVSTTGGPVMRLTERQRQVLAGRARGETFRRIARKLNISERTAHDHWAAVARNFAGFLTSHSPADLERSLGLDPGPAALAPEVTPVRAVTYERAVSPNHTAPGQRRSAPRGRNPVTATQLRHVSVLAGRV